MKIQRRVYPVLLIYFLATLQSRSAELPLTATATIEFADATRAAKELTATDAFIQALSPFDRAARKGADRPVAIEEFLGFVSAQALDWSDEEIQRAGAAVSSISNKLAAFRLEFPGKIVLVKTTGKEEGNAAYCRRSNVIVLPQSNVNSRQKLEDTLTHELFHILSRNNSKLRDSLYQIIGFKRCGRIELPESLRPLKITNPDAPIIEHSIDVIIADKEVQAAPVLFANKPNFDPASGKSFFGYLVFRLMVIEKQGERWIPKEFEGKPWLVDVADVQGFHEKVGRNTNYIIHPEEALADNFVLLAKDKRDVPSPEILEKMRGALLKQ